MHSTMYPRNACGFLGEPHPRLTYFKMQNLVEPLHKICFLVFVLSGPTAWRMMKQKFVTHMQFCWSGNSDDSKKQSHCNRAQPWQ